jgi:hypothetical protein
VRRGSLTDASALIGGGEWQKPVFEEYSTGDQKNNDLKLKRQ